MSRVLTAVLITVATVLGVAGPAFGGYWETTYPRIKLPLHQKSTDPGRLTVVADVRMGPNAWRPRSVIRNWDRRIGSVNVVFGNCADRPRVSCIVVRQVHRPKASWWGLVTWPDNRNWAYRRTVHLNTDPHRSQHVTCHEWGHALGMTHHTRISGCLHEQGANFLSRGEMRVFREYYGTP